MDRAFRLALPLLAAVALLAWAASAVAARVGRTWFHEDLALRAELAVLGAREPITRGLSDGDPDELRRVLNDLGADERILAAAACAPDGSTLAASDDHPGPLSCAAMGVRFGGIAALPPHGAHAPIDVDGVPVHVSVLPIEDGGRRAGFVVLVHDRAFIERRTDAARAGFFVGFAVLGLVFSATAVFIARESWHTWLAELRRMVRGGTSKEERELEPIVEELRELAEQLAGDTIGATTGGWTAKRLRHTLLQHLRGEKVVIVANREPYIHRRTKDGGVEVQHPASGLVTALEPVMRACSGTWVAHGSGSADRETADRHGRVRVPPGKESYTLRRVWLSEEEERGYYYGFANEGLWPLCHVAHARPVFRSDDFEHYRRVNRRFADAVCDEVDSDDPIVLVQDYHFALAPRMIRRHLPRATIITFWHIPWPNAERFRICPYERELLEGMLGSSIVGFHTQQHCNNFLEAIERTMEARVDREQFGVVHHGRWSLVRAYPISIEWPPRWTKNGPKVEECRASVREELGLAPDALVGLGVDRVDYTKGIEERFLAVERLLERHPRFCGRFTFVQLAAPSRTEIDRYRELNDSIERLAARINARFGTASWRPIVVRRDHHEPPVVFRHMRAADVCYVSSLHDGMNLVAKEFVAARDDGRGVLVLSQFTGAARELTEALVVNPYDLDEAAGALAAALEMPAAEQRERMVAMRAFVREWNVYRWAGRMLVDAARLRQADRLTGRLSDSSALLDGKKRSDRVTPDKHVMRPPPIRPAMRWRATGTEAARATGPDADAPEDGVETSRGRVSKA